MKPISLELGPSFCTYSNVQSDGSVVIASGASALVSPPTIDTTNFTYAPGEARQFVAT